MNLKPLLLPAMIALLSACTAMPAHQKGLVDASVKGDIREFGGATRLK